MSSAGSTALAALQSSISIILIIATGYASRKWHLLDEHGETTLSFLCNNLFLPLLLLSQVGPSLSPDNFGTIIPLFAFAAVEMILGYVLGYLGRKYVRPISSCQWITPALMFNNTTALPLLLARNLKETGIMKQLLRSSSDTVQDALDRTESYILINAVFHTVVRFGLGPWLMQTETSSEEEQTDGERDNHEDSEEEESTALLPQHRPTKVHSTNVLRLQSAAKWIYTKLKVWCNPALAGALLAVILGLIPFTHSAFYGEKGIFKSNIMQAVKQLGDLIPALLPFAVGSKLFSKPSKDAGYTAVAYLIFCRFVLIPGLCILAVFLAKRKNSADYWVDDPAFDFALIISGAGPPAITLMSVAEIGGAEPEMLGKVARTLLLSYASTPAISGAVVAGLSVIKSIYHQSK